MKKFNMRKNIIYYDGECGLFHIVVRFILRIDSKNKFYFSPISNLNDNKKQKKPDSIILSFNDTLYYEGQAIINIMKNIGNNWCLLVKALEFIPKGTLDEKYGWVSRNRNNWLSKRIGVYPSIPIHLRERFILE